MNSDAKYIISQLNMLPHPEGGYYKETYRSDVSFESERGLRSVGTQIYFLLQDNDVSKFHRLTSDETWHYYKGTCAFDIFIIDDKGNLKIEKLGNNFIAGEIPQLTIPAGHWFASRLNFEKCYALAGCSVNPGFDFNDFEMAEREQLLNEYPQHRELIEQLT